MKSLTAIKQDDVDYRLYCAALDYCITQEAGILDSLRKAKGLLGGKLLGFIEEVKPVLEDIAQDFKLSLREVVKAFRNKEAFSIFRAFKFSLRGMVKAIAAGTKVLRSGVLKIFREISKSGAIDKLRNGLMTVDQLLEMYPILKRLTGIAVAGILLYIWLNMTFIGDAEFDLNIADMFLALKGSFSLAELFASPADLAMLALLGTGFMGLSFPWLGKSAYNLVLAISYTLFKKANISRARGLFKRLKIGRV